MRRARRTEIDVAGKGDRWARTREHGRGLRGSGEDECCVRRHTAGLLCVFLIYRGQRGCCDFYCRGGSTDYVSVRDTHARRRSGWYILSASD